MIYQDPQIQVVEMTAMREVEYVLCMYVLYYIQIEARLKIRI